MNNPGINRDQLREQASRRAVIVQSERLMQSVNVLSNLTHSLASHADILEVACLPDIGPIQGGKSRYVGAELTFAVMTYSDDPPPDVMHKVSDTHALIRKVHETVSPILLVDKVQIISMEVRPEPPPACLYASVKVVVAIHP